MAMSWGLKTKLSTRRNPLKEWDQRYVKYKQFMRYSNVIDLIGHSVLWNIFQAFKFQLKTHIQKST